MQVMSSPPLYPAVCTHRPALNANTAIYLLSGPRTPAHRQRTTQPLRNNTLEHSDGKIAHIYTRAVYRGRRGRDARSERCSKIVQIHSYNLVFHVIKCEMGGPFLFLTASFTKPIVAADRQKCSNHNEVNVL